MARVYGIQKRLEKKNFDERTVKEIIGNGDLVDIIARMEKSLDPETMVDILDTCACGGGRDFIKQCERIGKELSGKPLSEKVDYLNNNIFDAEKITLSADKLLSGTLEYKENETYKCVCSAAVKNGMTVADLVDDAEGRVMPLSYCFCCAGSFRRHLQLQLGITLKTKEIVSSPINSKGEQPCAFVFDIL